MSRPKQNQTGLAHQSAYLSGIPHWT